MCWCKVIALSFCCWISWVTFDLQTRTWQGSWLPKSFACYGADNIAEWTACRGYWLLRACYIQGLILILFVMLFLFSRLVCPWWNAWFISAICDDHQEIGLSYMVLYSKRLCLGIFIEMSLMLAFLFFLVLLFICVWIWLFHLINQSCYFTPYQLFFAADPADVENVDLLILSSQWAGVAYIRQVKLSKLSFILLLNSI